MKGLVVSPSVLDKLSKKQPPVTTAEIIECFTNRSGIYLLDEREDHQSDPPTRWFIAQTDYGRQLKVCFIQRDGKVIIRTAYDPNPIEIKIYSKHGQ